MKPLRAFTAIMLVPPMTVGYIVGFITAALMAGFQLAWKHLEGFSNV